MPRPNLTQALAPLKDFQRRTVNHAFERLFLAEDRTCRFLVADEVGLGKTMVARGLIARAIDHLWEKIDRLDIIYICSNADIARQNINRLHPDPGSSHDFALATRITLLPLQIQNLKHNKLNFISFTPGTSFDMGNSGGQARERALIYHMLEDHWQMRGEAPYKVFAHLMNRGNFKWHIERVRVQEADADLMRDFLKNLTRSERVRAEKGEQSLRERFEWLCDYMRRRTNYSDKARWRQRYLLGQLRLILADACIDALEPDLIILDEFQRFKSLLAGDDAAGELAQALFRHSDAHTLLLSATPYKMYTLADEQETDDHYRDFLSTVEFLYQGDDHKALQCDSLLKQYRQAMFAGRLDLLPQLKQAIEGLLKKVMSRMEKVSGSQDRNALIRTVHTAPQLVANDLHSFVHLNALTAQIGQPMPLSYWQSAPYLLNFMRGYQLKRAFEKSLEEAETATQLQKAQHLLLPAATIEQFGALDPNNARLRSLLAETVDAGAWQLLWLPPSLPYYQLDMPFSTLPTLTKRLIFSAWQVVPHAVASLISYAAEREMLRSYEDEPHYTKRTSPLLNFAQREERLTGMPVLGMLYPCATLARLGEMLPISADPSTLQTLKTAINARVTEHLVPLNLPTDTGGRADERWYWAVPILLDRHFAPEMTAFWEREHLAAVWQADEEHDESTVWAEHVTEARKLWENGDTHDWGHPPGDLVDVLTLLAVAGLGIVPLRSFGRLFPEAHAHHYAAQVAWAFRSLFNTPEVIALVRKRDSGDPYWRHVLEYAAAGCLQAVLDEYCHVLRESLGLFDFSAEKTIAQLTATMRDVITLRTPSLSYDDISVRDGNIHSETQRIRTHFALRFGDLRDDSAQLTRKEAVREAFNSPFWPFVLVSTSVGQEGLDFHLYCHALVHWNLPSNPVDLEQREGRIHRYKSHAVRKNVAHFVGDSVEFWQSDSADSDLWQRLFTYAHTQSTRSDLVPFWIYPAEGEPFAHIERHVPALPLSRDLTRFTRLQRALTVYRMAFGQNRQEDLLNYLLSRFSEEEVNQLIQDAQIDLSPPSQTTPTNETKY